jgi:hypothetical protein
MTRTQFVAALTIVQPMAWVTWWDLLAKFTSAAGLS